MKGLKLSRKTRSLLAGFMGAVLFIGSMNIGAAAEEGNDVKQDIPDFVYASETDLGSAGGFAVFANDFSNKNHMEGTIAARCFNPSSQYFGVTDRVYYDAVHGSYYYYFENITVDNGTILGFEKGPQAGGNNYPVVFPSNAEIRKDEGEDAHVYHIFVDGIEVSNNINNIATDISDKVYYVSNLTDNQKIDFDKAFTSLKSYSNHMKSALTDVTEIIEKNGKKVIVCQEGNNVVNLSYSELTSDYWDVEAAEGVEPRNYSLVINVTDIQSDKCELINNVQPNFSIDNKRASGEVFPEAEKVLFNFGDYSGHLVLGDCMNAGIILAPDAYVEIRATHNGNVIANKVANTNGEIHQCGFDQKKAIGATPSPSVVPSESPSVVPSESPSVVPSESPSVVPSVSPSVVPSVSPSVVPSESPSVVPSVSPSVVPSVSPSVIPSVSPSVIPSESPSVVPSVSPSVVPSVSPSVIPSVSPSVIPSVSPSVVPSVSPSVVPSVSPSVVPSVSPSVVPSVSPSVVPSVSPSVIPSVSPSVVPSVTPSVSPSVAPSQSAEPTRTSTETPAPTTTTPTQNPGTTVSDPNASQVPTTVSGPNASPSTDPTESPSVSANASVPPTADPTQSASPAQSPSASPATNNNNSSNQGTSRATVTDPNTNTTTVVPVSYTYERSSENSKEVTITITSIPDEYVPTSNTITVNIDEPTTIPGTPVIITIEEEDVPLAGAPRTGENNILFMIFGSAFTMVVVAGITYFFSKKSEEA